jgi:hypothetical protein
MGTTISISYFFLNKKAIVAEHCVQRYEEKNTCQGNCVLAEKTKEISKIPTESNTEEIEVKIPQFNGEINSEFITQKPISPYVYSLLGESFQNHLHISNLLRPPIIG